MDARTLCNWTFCTWENLHISDPSQWHRIETVEKLKAISMGYPSLVHFENVNICHRLSSCMCKIESDKKPTHGEGLFVSDVSNLTLHRIKNIRISYSANQVLQWWQYSLHNPLCEDVEKVLNPPNDAKNVFFWSFINVSLRWLITQIEDSFTMQLCFWSDR